MRISIALAAAGTAWLGGCASAPPEPAAARVAERPAGAVVHALEPGSVLRLLPSAAVTEGGFDQVFADALWREAMRQSVRFDIAAGLDDVSELPQQPVLGLSLRADLTARLLTCVLEPVDAPPVPLGSSTLQDRDLPAAIDELAWRCRIALGEDAEAPVPVAACYTGDAAAAHDAERALRLLGLGDFAAAARAAADARRRDGGSPFVLELLAASALLRGDADAARKLAEEGLAYPLRLSPATAHRLARALLLARSSLYPGQAAARDRELLLLGDVAGRERPFDPQVQFTRAVALDFLERFDEAVPLLRRLAQRLPHNALVGYHLGWAELAAGDAAAAVQALQEAAVVLPRANTVLPRALALYAAGDHARLDDFLQELVEAALPQPDPAVHELRRMQAAHALLTERPQRAGDIMLTDLAWLLQRPSLLQQRAGEIADAGEVLVRLGRVKDLSAPLQALAGMRPNGALADALAFLTGLQQVALSGHRAEAIEAALAKSGGVDVWSCVLRAVGHRATGELLDEYSALVQASKLSDSPLIKAALVRSLRATGRIAEAVALRQAMRREMLAVHLRQPMQHPLLGPELALAFLVE